MRCTIWYDVAAQALCDDTEVLGADQVGFLILMDNFYQITGHGPGKVDVRLLNKRFQGNSLRCCCHGTILLIMHHLYQNASYNLSI